MLKLQATEFVHTLADVGRLKDSIANAIVSHVTVGLSKTVDQLRTLCTQPHCRLLHLLEGARVRSMGFDISDGFHNRKPLSVFHDQLHCAFLKDYQYTPLTDMGASQRPSRPTSAYVFNILSRLISLSIVNTRCVRDYFRVRPYTMCRRSCNLRGMGIW